MFAVPLLQRKQSFFPKKYIWAQHQGCNNPGIFIQLQTANQGTPEASDSLHADQST